MKDAYDSIHRPEEPVKKEKEPQRERIFEAPQIQWEPMPSALPVEKQQLE